MKAANAGFLLFSVGAVALDLDAQDQKSISHAAQTIASRIVEYSTNFTIPGLFPDPYYYWESGLAWDSLINYWAATGDDSYNTLIGKALLFQRGSDDFLPANQTKSEGNDDQSFWALAAMTAAERAFPVPSGQNISWLQLAENVFNEQVARWDAQTCAGGIRWQIFLFNNGYSYKNTLTNGNFYQLASRLAFYTGNTTYTEWARKTLQWSVDVGLVTNGSSSGAVYDGTDSTGNCTQINRIQWSASAGTYLSGASYSGDDFAHSLLANINSTFAKQSGVLAEIACQFGDNCDVDQLAFRAVLARALASTRDLNNSKNKTSNQTLTVAVDSLIRSSALAAAAQCSGGAQGTTCGSDWGNSTWDGTMGLGQDLSALNMIVALIPQTTLRNANTTGTSGVHDGSGSLNGTANGTVNGTAAGTTVSTGEANGLPASSFALLAGIAFVITFFV